MVFFQSLGIVPLLIVMSSNRARYDIVASPPSFRISPETLSGPIDLFLPIAANLFLMTLVLMLKGSPELGHCTCGMLRSQLNFLLLYAFLTFNFNRFTSLL
jgi:hypothetical protein